MTAAGRFARGAGATLLVLWLAACSVLDPTYTAATPGPSGRAPVEVEVAFAGNSGIAGIDLRRRIEDYLFDLSRDPTRESAVYDAALELEDLYRTDGYPIAKVDYDYVAPPEDGPWPAVQKVRFRIDEGPLVTVDMRLDGNRVYGRDRLLALWARKRHGTFSLGGYVFVESQVRTFVEELRSFYRSQGRLDAVVQGPAIEVDLERAVAKVTIAVEEGNVHSIGAVDVAAALREALGDDLPPPPVGRPQAQGELQGYRTALRNALRQRGYPAPALTLRLEPAADAPLVARLEVGGEPGRRMTIANVTVAGNDRTMAGVIRGKLDLAEGDRYDGMRIDDALTRLYRTGLFRKVDIRETPVEGDPSRLDLGIQVEENESRSIEFLGGYGSYEQLRGGLRLEDRNVFGTGRGVVLDNRISQKGNSNELTLSDPDFLATGAVLTIGGERFLREEPSFTDKAIGGTVALARPLFGGLTARVGYTYRDRQDARAFTVLPQDQLVEFTEGKVFVELRNDRRDNLLFPKAGHTELLSFERISPAFGASVDLDRLAFRAAVHLGLLDPFHLVLRSEQSVLWPHEGSALVPLQERWFSGGESSVRSFRESRLGPQDVDGLPVGGEYRNVFGAELRFPVWRTLEGALFVDAGNVGARVQDFSLDDMRYAIGAGIRLLLPIGPVRLDGGWNPDQRPGDDEWAVHLSVGYPF
ncbi:MAG: BamA/TamA family outer membrane protein [Planctomycetes bacterium]|nr:BamA/TamA family outer membrane protein [Planctomycetota bacterium]